MMSRFASRTARRIVIGTCIATYTSNSISAQTHQRLLDGPHTVTQTQALTRTAHTCGPQNSSMARF